MVAFILILVCGLAALLVWTWILARRAVAAVPQAGRKVSVAGGAIHYVESGHAEAPPIVLIHGLSAQLQHFSYGVAEGLAEDFRVIAVDRPGCGYSERNREHDSALPAQARMLWEFLDKIGVEQPVLCGHSLGGAVALTMALQRPGSVRALALLAPVTRVPEQVPDIFKGLELRTRAMRRLMAYTLAGPVGSLVKGQIFRKTFLPEPPPADFLTKAAAILGLRPRAFVTACCDMMMLDRELPEQIARYDQLNVAGGILFGEQDSIIDPDLHGRQMSEFGLSFHGLPDRGHMLPVTAPRHCIDFIRELVSGLESDQSEEQKTI